MTAVRYASEPPSKPLGAATSGGADAQQNAQAACDAVSRAVQPTTRRRTASSPAKQSRSTASTPPVTTPKSPPIEPQPSAKAQPATPAGKQDGIPTTAPTKRPAPPGRPFLPGNTMQKQRVLTTAEIRTMAKTTLTRPALKRILRRLTAIAATASPREALGAARMLLDLAADGEVAQGNTSGPVITMPSPPPR